MGNELYGVNSQLRLRTIIRKILQPSMLFGSIDVVESMPFHIQSIPCQFNDKQTHTELNLTEHSSEQLLGISRLSIASQVSQPSSYETIKAVGYAFFYLLVFSHFSTNYDTYRQYTLLLMLVCSGD